MRKYMFLLLVVILTLGCSQPVKEKKVVLVKINNYEITREEFQEEFKESAFSRNDTLESRQEFLDNLINRKLILQDAQRQGLDKDKSFLKRIQKFWEQSLLKLALDNKTTEIAISASITDQEIAQAYQKIIKDASSRDKTYQQMYNQLKWEITKTKESQAMSDWVADLRKGAAISINYGLLEKDK